MLDVLCACEPTWKLRSPSAPPCERTFTTCSSPLELPAAILGASARPNNIGHDPAGLSMNWPTLLISRSMFGSPVRAPVVRAEVHPAAACHARSFKSTVAPRKVCPGGGAMEVILLGTGG